jgi:hypothetical protein
MTSVAQDDPTSPPLGPVIGTLPAHLFQQEVLRRLGPTDLASLAGAGRGRVAAVAATTLIHAVGQTREAENPLVPRELCLREACSHAAGGGKRGVGVATRHRLHVECADMRSCR